MTDTDQAWDEHWSKLNGDTDISWGPDPLLTPLGELQAQQARNAWKAELPLGVPVPQRWYSSPLKRALDTWKITFDSDEGLFGKKQVTILEVCACVLVSERH